MMSSDEEDEEENEKKDEKDTQTMSQMPTDLWPSSPCWRRFTHELRRNGLHDFS